MTCSNCSSINMGSGLNSTSRSEKNLNDDSEFLTISILSMIQYQDFIFMENRSKIQKQHMRIDLGMWWCHVWISFWCQLASIIIPWIFVPKTFFIVKTIKHTKKNSQFCCFFLLIFLFVFVVLTEYTIDMMPIMFIYNFICHIIMHYIYIWCKITVMIGSIECNTIYNCKNKRTVSRWIWTTVDVTWLYNYISIILMQEKCQLGMQ